MTLWVKSRTQVERAQGPPKIGGFGSDACRNRSDLIARASNQVSAGTSQTHATASCTVSAGR